MASSIHVGRRKSAVARASITRGSGKLTLNGREFEDYFPTEKGADLGFVLLAMQTWGNRWVFGEQGPYVLHAFDERLNPPDPLPTDWQGWPAPPRLVEPHAATAERPSFMTARK